jgi:hypothetical protein
MGKTLKKIIGVVAIVGLAIVTGGTSLVAKFALSAVLSFGVSKLLGNRAGSKAAGAESNGARIQLPPGTNNKLPVTYGTAFLGSATTDAKISTDQKTMWFVQAVTEVPDGATITFNQIYYDNKLVTFGTNGAVASLTNNAQGSPQVDTKVANKIFIYLFPNGSSSGINTGGLTANQILSDASIPVSQRWNGPIYTTGGQSPTMSNTAFMIIKLIYDEQAGVTGLGTLTAKVTCSITKPGAAILDYMRNERYGCAIPLAQIDTASLTALDTYSDGLINYINVNGNPATQARYRINGPLDTGIDCLTNLQNLVDACDSWLQYSEITGKWKVVINKAYNQSPGAQTINDLYSVTSSNLVGGIDISPVDLNGTFNQLEVQYPDVNIKDQTNYAYIDLFTEYPTLISANEPINKLIVQNQLVNNFVQAKFIGIRRLLQSREDLIIDLQLDYSGIQLEAGDVIKVTLAEYGWTNKLFRVSAVIEEKFADGSLGAKIQAFEYNDTIYDNNLNITDFIPADNTGLTDPNIISKPPAPIVVPNVSGTLNFLDITGNVPNVGLVMSLDFNYGFDSNTANHVYYTTINNSNGAPLIPNSTYSINVNNIEQSGNIFWSTTARNRQAGNQSNASTVAVWPGANVSVYNPIGNTGGITGNNIQYATITANNLANGASRIAVQDEGTTILNANTINFVGTAVAVSNVGNVATVTVTGGSGNGIYSYINDNSFFLQGGVNPPDAINIKGSYGAARIPGDRQANASTGNFETYTFDSFYPWWTGDSLTTNGYFSNSGSGRMNPANAGIQDISSPVNMGGRAGWWTTIGAPVTSGFRTANTQIRNQSQIQVTSDADLAIEVAGWYKIQEIANVANISNAIKPDTTIGTYSLANTVPITLNLDFTVDANATFAIYDVGMCVRVIGTGNAFVLTGTSLTSTPSGWDYNNVGWITP